MQMRWRYRFPNAKLRDQGILMKMTTKHLHKVAKLGTYFVIHKLQVGNINFDLRGVNIDFFLIEIRKKKI